MTDNRTNEPKQTKTKSSQDFVFAEAQIEAAAKAIADNLFPNWSLFSRARASKDRGSLIHVAASAALEAAARTAQGAAPQEEDLPETGDELRDEGGDLISSGKHLRILQQGMYVCDTCTNVLGLNVRWDHAIKRDDHAPVLPSSGVDETWRGRIVTASFEDGEGGFDCGLEPCNCPEHENEPMPAGTYVTVRLDKDERVGLADVEIRVLAGKEKNE